MEDIATHRIFSDYSRRPRLAGRRQKFTSRESAATRARYLARSTPPHFTSILQHGPLGQPLSARATGQRR